MKEINTCFTKDICGQTLGALINPTLKKLAGLDTLEAVAECPIESLMTGNVQFSKNTPLDILEVFLSEETEAMAKYLEKPNVNTEYAKKRLARIAEAQNAVHTMRINKSEVWLHIFPHIRAAEREFGLAGNVQINFPLRFDVSETLYLDFITGRATAWMR